MREFQPKLVDNKISIFVRRAGPNYQEGLRRMREFGGTLGVPLHVFGPETHMTAICGKSKFCFRKPFLHNYSLYFRNGFGQENYSKKS